MKSREFIILMLLALATSTKSHGDAAMQAAVAPDAQAERPPAVAKDSISSAGQTSSDSNTLSVAGWYVIIIHLFRSLIE